MYTFRTLQTNHSVTPMMALGECAVMRDVQFVVYDLHENHVVSAVAPPQVVNGLRLEGKTLDEIKRHSGDNRFAILAFETAECNVYAIDFVPEMHAATGVLLAVVQELMGGVVMRRKNLSGKPVVVEGEYHPSRRSCHCNQHCCCGQSADQVKGNFMTVKIVNDEPDEEPWKNIPSLGLQDSIGESGFKLGRLSQGL